MQQPGDADAPAHASAPQVSEPVRASPPSARVIVKTETSAENANLSQPAPANSAYQPLLTFVVNAESNKPSLEKRKHVMRDYRRKQRWEELQQKRIAMGLDGAVTGAEVDAEYMARKLASAAREHDHTKKQSDKRLSGRKRYQETQRLATQLLPSVSELPVLDVFVERFVDAFAPIPDWGINCGRSDAIRTAATVRHSSQLLRTAFNAVSTTFLGQFIGDRRIVSAGHKNYLAVLKGLQAALTDAEESRSNAVLATVILLMAYESLQHTTETALINHCMGALRLIEFRGPESHQEGVEHQCFSELQPYWVATAVVTRSPSFLARDEWQTVPWSAPGVQKDIMQLLLDIVAHIPGLLARYDKFDAATKNHAISFTEYTRQEDMLWAAVTDIEHRLRTWKREVADTYPAGQPVEVAGPLGQEAFPVFFCRELATGQTFAPTNLAYPDPQLARTLAMYWTAMLLLSSVDRRKVNAIQPYDQYEFACLICRTMQYYIITVPGHMINRMAFPMRVAYDAMREGGLERAYLSSVFQLVEKKKFLKSWGGLIGDVSPMMPAST